MLQPDLDPTDAADRELVVALQQAKSALTGAGGEAVRPPDPAVVRAVTTAAVKLVARQAQLGVFENPFLQQPSASPTEVAIAVLNLLSAADIELPEIAMWDAMGMGVPRDNGGEGPSVGASPSATTSSEG